MNYLHSIPLEIRCLTTSSLPTTRELVKEIDNEKLNNDFLEWENTVSVITTTASSSTWKIIKANKDNDSRNRVLDILQLTKQQLHDLDKVYVERIKAECSSDVVLPPLRKLFRKDILGLCSAVYLDKESEHRLSAILTDLSHADTYVKLDEVRKNLDSLREEVFRDDRNKRLSDMRKSMVTEKLFYCSYNLASLDEGSNARKACSSMIKDIEQIMMGSNDDQKDYALLDAWSSSIWEAINLLTTETTPEEKKSFWERLMG